MSNKLEPNSKNKSKPWNNNSTHISYESADVIRNKLLAVWSKYPDKHTGMQVKVRRMASGKFVVKTRLHPDYEPREEKKEKRKEKKRGKDSRRNKKNSSRRNPNSS